jgi:hypothetical protein
VAGKHFQPSQMFVGKARAYTRVKYRKLRRIKFYNIRPWSYLEKRLANPLTAVFKNAHTELMVVTGKPFQPILMFESEAGAYPSEAPLSSSTLG